MCGRTVTHKGITEIESEFEAKFNYNFEPIYNGAPTVLLPVITNKEPELIQAFRFGFIAPWNPKLPVFNTVSETAHEKKMFSDGVKGKRCLVIVTGFYEWMNLEPEKKTNPKKQPYFVFLKDQPIFALAGIWDECIDRGTGEVTKCFSILTTTPNDLMERIKHHRCPVILEKVDRKKWLAGSPEDISKLLGYKYSADKMNAYPVNKLSSNGAECIEAIGETVYK